jgi:D-alanyl-D-alanine dipeptidase
MMRVFTILIALLSLFACGEQPTNAYTQLAAASLDTVPPPKKQQAAKPKREDLKAAGFADVEKLDASILIDIRYATTNNFMKAKVYDCARCLLRPEAATAVVKAQKILKTKGYGLKMHDCYRPRPYQQRLWDKVPDPNYVTPPAKGSMHSRGAAVDLTVVDAQGNELDMGTPYDFFGVEAHSDYTKLPQKVLDNRRLLTETMTAVGFKGIRTEWWHFSFQGKNYPLSDFLWQCNE